MVGVKWRLVAVVALLLFVCGGCSNSNSDGQLNTGDGTSGDGSSQGGEVQQDAAPDMPLDLGVEDLGPQDLGAEDLVEDVVPVEDLTPQPDTNVSTPDTNSGTGLGKLGKACVDLLSSFCKEILAKCDQMPIVGKLITGGVVQTCHDVVNASPEAQEALCKQADTATANDPTYGPLVLLGPAMVTTCKKNFQCTQAKMTAVVGELVPILTDLAGGTSPSLDSFIPIAFELCTP